MTWRIEFDDGDHATIEADDFDDAVAFIKRMWTHATKNITSLSTNHDCPEPAPKDTVS